jgi:hypothetical protein
LVGLAFLAFLLVALAGWGALLLGTSSTLKPYAERTGLCAATGLCLYLAFAAFPEMALVRLPGAITIFLCVGAVLFVFRRPRLRLTHLAGEAGSFWQKASLAAALCALLLLSANAAVWQFGNVDDVQGYLGYIERVFQAGSTGRDPFTYRRFEAGLGGGTYLYALGEPLRELSRLRIVDIGGGIAILAAMILADLRTKPSGSCAAALAALAVAVAFSPAMNMAPDILGMALIYAFLRFGALLADNSDRRARAALVGLFVFALVCTKTTFIVPAAAIAGALYATLLLQERSWAVVREGMFAAAVALLLMAPWMLISNAAAGTPLFPMLGVGRLSPLEGSGFASSVDFAKAAGRIALILAFPLWIAVRRRSWPTESRQLFVRLAIVLGSVLILAAQVKFSVSGYRYGYSAAAALFLFCLVEWLKEPLGRTERRLVIAAAPLLVLNVALYPILKPGYGADAFRSGILYSGPSSVNAAEERAKVRRMQSAIPAGAALLVRTDRPFDLDFNRNPILKMDWPGLTGPGGQPPPTDSAEFWRGYLLRNQVRYVAWSYASQAGMAEDYLLGLIRQSDSAFFRDQIGRTVLTQRAFERLRQSQHILFDDGETVVMDLSPPRGAAGKAGARLPSVEPQPGSKRV